MNTLCIVLLVSLTGYVRSVVVNEDCTPPAVCDDGLYCEANVCKVKANMTCAADQCITRATCVDSMCKCGADHTPSTDMSMCLNNIGQDCTADKDCVHGATCEGDAGSAKCECNATSMVPKDDNSMCQLKIHQNCSADPTMCMVGTTCKEQTCMCPEKSGPNTAMDKCLWYIEETCETKADCVDENTDNVVCTDKKCACAAKYAPSDKMDMCKLELNQTCSKDGDCGMHAECSTLKCACKANFVNEENRCGMKVGGACTGDTHCVMNAECKSEKCACSGTYTSDGDYCKSGSAAVVASLLLLVAALVTSRLM